MRLLTYILLAAAVSLMLVYASGQQVYQSHHYGSPGVQNLYSTHSGGFTNDEIFAHGDSVIWDISTLFASDLGLSEIVTRDQAINAT